MYRPNLKLSSAYLDGSESLSSSKFNLLLHEIMKRIERERASYSACETATCLQLLQLANALEMLFTTQDTPLYLTQNPPAVNELAQELVLYHHQPLVRDELSPKHRAEYDGLKTTYDEQIRIRNILLDEYLTTEKCMWKIDRSCGFELDCLLGMSRRVRDALEHLSEFNARIATSYDRMMAEETTDAGHRVNFVLDKIEDLKAYHLSLFGEQARRRQEQENGYARVFTKFSTSRAPHKKLRNINTEDYSKLK